MPDKARSSKGKNAHQSKKRREKQRLSVPHPPEARPAAAAPADIAPLPAKETTITAAAKPAAQHPYIFSELRRIGILAGIILVILVILALVLS